MIPGFSGTLSENDRFKYTTFDEAFAKLKTSEPGTFDLVSITNCYVDEWVKAGVLQEVQTDLIPNWAGMYEPFQRSTHAVPFTWGTVPLNYNSDHMEKPDSWSVFLDPALKNKIAIVDDVQVIYHAALINGSYSTAPHMLTQEELDETIDYLRKLLNNSNVIAAGFGDILSLFISEEVWTSFIGWEYYSIGSKGEGVPVELTIPSEGSFSWVDNYCIVEGSKNLEAVHGLLNQLISEEAQEFWGNYLAAGVVTPAALDVVDPTFVEYFEYDDIDNYLTNVAPLFTMPAREMEEGITNYSDWQNAWTALKSEFGI